MSGSQMFLAPPEDERFKKTFFRVEATSFEKHCLWQEWHDKVNWEQESSGYVVQIGTLDDRPVTLSVFWARINGQLVAFWEITSPVADYTMVEKWFSMNCAPQKWDKGTRPARCNPSNFHFCVEAIREANKNTVAHLRKVIAR